MEKVNYVLDVKNLNEDVKEMLLSYGGDYCKDDVKVDAEQYNVIITQYIGEDEYRFYGFKVEGNIYIGRVQYISGFPKDMYIDEFFNFGQVM